MRKVHLKACLFQEIQEILGVLIVDDLLLLEIERLRQMLIIASKDVSKAYNCKPSDYLHDLSTRDFFEEC